MGNRPSRGPTTHRGAGERSLHVTVPLALERLVFGAVLRVELPAGCIDGAEDLRAGLEVVVVSAEEAHRSGVQDVVQVARSTRREVSGVDLRATVGVDVGNQSHLNVAS